MDQWALDFLILMAFNIYKDCLYEDVRNSFSNFPPCYYYIAFLFWCLVCLFVCVFVSFYNTKHIKINNFEFN